MAVPTPPAPNAAETVGINPTSSRAPDVPEIHLPVYVYGSRRGGVGGGTRPPPETIVQHCVFLMIDECFSGLDVDHAQNLLSRSVFEAEAGAFVTRGGAVVVVEPKKNTSLAPPCFGAAASHYAGSPTVGGGAQ